MAKNRITGGGKAQKPEITVLRNIDWREWEKSQLILSDALIQRRGQNEAVLELFCSGFHSCRVMQVEDPRILQGSNRAGRFAAAPEQWSKAFFEFDPGQRVTIEQLIVNPSLWPDETGLSCQWRTLLVGESVRALYRSEGELRLIKSKEFHLGKPLVNSAGILDSVACDIGWMVTHYDENLWPQNLRSIATAVRYVLLDFEQAQQDLLSINASAHKKMKEPVLVVATDFEMPFADGLERSKQQVFCVEDKGDWEEMASINRSWAPQLVNACIVYLPQLEGDEEKAAWMQQVDSDLHPNVFILDASEYTVRRWKERKRR